MNKTANTPVQTRPSALSVEDLHAAYREGSLSPVKVAEDVVDAVNRRNGELNVFTDFDEEAVLREAAESAQRWEQGSPRGFLDGVPCTVKENLKRRGIAYQSGTLASVEYVPERNSPSVDRLEEAGAVIVGSTTMPDVGMLSSGISSRNGITRSPWDPALTVGGSSSGAGAAAAAGFGAIHLGTDIGGSIRFPGAWLGLASLKPTAGRVPHDIPYLGRAVGPLTRKVRDLARAMEVLSLPDERDYTAMPMERVDWMNLNFDPAKVRIGVLFDAKLGLEPDPQVLAAVRAAVDHFAAAGAHIEEIAPFVEQEMIDGCDLFWRVRGWNSHRKLPIELQRSILPFVYRWLSRGADVAGADVLDAYDTIHTLRQTADEATRGFDIVLSPVSPVAAFPAEWPMPWGAEEDHGQDHTVYTLAYNMTGQPAATVNCGFTSDDRPIGLQVIGRRGADLAVLQAADWYEHTRPESAVPHFPVS